MEQLEEMKASIVPEIELQLEKRIAWIAALYDREQERFIKILAVLLSDLELATEGSLVITYLRSSYITQSHRFKIAFYPEVPFVKEDPDFTVFDFTPFLEGVEEDTESLKHALQKRIVNIFSCYQEEISRYYMGRLYQKSICLFQQLIRDIKSEGNTISVFFGDEMGEIECIGTIGLNILC